MDLVIVINRFNTFNKVLTSNCWTREPAPQYVRLWVFNQGIADLWWSLTSYQRVHDTCLQLIERSNLRMLLLPVSPKSSAPDMNLVPVTKECGLKIHLLAHTHQ